MTVHFRNGKYPGTHGVLMTATPELRASRVVYSGVAGQSEIRVAITGRKITCTLLLHNDYEKLTDLEQALNYIDRGVGVHGTLWTTKDADTDPEASTRYRYCTFDGFERLAMQGQDRPSPLLDGGGNIGGWFQYGVLHFWQLRVN